MTESFQLNSETPHHCKLSKMTEKNKKMKSVHANIEAPKIQKEKKKKKSYANSEKANLFNQISDSEKFNLSRCQQKKKKSVPPHHTCKGKSVVESSQMDIVASQGSMGDEIMMTILSWLPVSSLFRFKCVSKSWDLTSDPYFKMKHQSHDLDNSLKFLVIRPDIRKNNSYNFYSSSLSSVEDVQALDCPSNCEPHFFRIYSCCDGLVLLSVVDQFDEQLLLWNPSTRESLVLPHPEFKLFESTFGFGYDATSDDYKILKIHQKPPDSHRHKSSCEILSLKSGSWRKNCNRPYSCAGANPLMDAAHRMDPLVFLHGAFHWVGLCNPYNLVSFSISNEVYEEITLPEQLWDDFHDYIGLSSEFGVSVLEGMLCFYCTSYKNKGTFKLWAMKDYGVKESWTQLLTIQHRGLFSAKPRYMFADGDVLLRCRSYKCKGAVFRTSKGPFGLWCGVYGLQDGIVFRESLISPKLLI